MSRESPNKSLDQAADRIQRCGRAYGPPLISSVVRPFGSMSMVNGMVGIVLGVAFFLIGLGKASVSKNAEANAAFVKKYGRFF